MAQALIGIGANLGDAVAQVRATIAELGALRETRLVAASSLYRTAPVGYAEQADFINAVAMLDTALAPHELLQALHALEQQHGRERSFRNAPRTLDLDLLLYDDLTLDDEVLTLPHPRMHERAFVLAPLVEIDAERIIPGRGRARDLLARCAEQRIERLA